MLGHGRPRLPGLLRMRRLVRVAVERVEDHGAGPERPEPVQVDGHAEAFLALRGALSLSTDDFIRTSRDPRHRPGVERFWRACDAAGDLYRRRYQGRYCTGCEQFYSGAELRGGRCPEHETEPEQ